MAPLYEYDDPMGWRGPPPVMTKPGPQPHNRIAGTFGEQLARARRKPAGQRPLTRAAVKRALHRRDADHAQAMRLLVARVRALEAAVARREGVR